MQTRIFTRAIAAAATVAVVAPLAGCNTYDPLLRDGLWHPTHPSRSNLAMMAASPADLVRGHGSTAVDANLVIAPIDRLEAGKVKRLPDAGLSDVSVHGQGGNE
jgi:type IV pilus biogenesis protein CpaD/CtpE